MNIELLSEGKFGILKEESRQAVTFWIHKYKEQTPNMVV
jgi:hypothetical protein